jgi:membrane protease YdiL (CAAX protease family)
MRTDARALQIFFFVTCIPPWIGWSLLTFGVVPQNASYAPLLYITGWGCSAGGLIATYASEGRDGVRRLLRQAVRVNVPVLWWLYVLVVPVAMQVSIALVSFEFGRVPIAIHPAALLALATPALLLPVLMGPFGEEFGWRGFLLPHLVQRFSVLPACLILGVVWGLWHWPLAYRQMGDLVFYTTCVSFMLAAVYLHTRSVLLAMIMHWNFNSMPLLSPKLFPGLPDTDGSIIGKLGAFGVMALFAALTIPVLLARNRDQAPSSLDQAATPGHVAARSDTGDI